MIALFYGGCSLEHEISILSTLQFVKYFEKDEVILVYVSKENKFYIGECLYDFDFYSKMKLSQCKEVILEKKETNVYLKTKELFPRKIMIDCVFPLMHGLSGEDGSIQGVFELLDIPYAESKLSTCAIFMDKDLTRKMFQVHQIPYADGITLYKQDVLKNLDSLNQIKIEKPWILKPARGGSSIGINCVYEDDEMNQKVLETFSFDSKIVLERKYEKIREFNVAVLGNTYEQKVSHIEEIHVSDDYYSYSDKYGGSVVKQKPASRTCPADIYEDLEKEIKELARKAFIQFECSGVVRFDFLYSDHLMMNEVNIIPGSYSMYLFKGIRTPKEMIEILKNCAIENYMEKAKEIRNLDSFIFKKNWNDQYLKK